MKVKIYADVGQKSILRLEKIMMQRLIKLIIGAVSFFILSGATGSTDVTQVYLIQNSGWMEPFFEDPQSQMRPLTAAIIKSSVITGQEIVIASFNQNGSVVGEVSPKIIFKGIPKGDIIKKSIELINLPKGANGKYADADYEGTLNGTIADILQRKSGIIWMITNNKNDPNNSPDVVSHTKSFYKMLREHAEIKTIVAFPITMKTKGKHFQEGGLMIYALSFGDKANRQLESILNSAGVKELFPRQPVRIKPLNEQPVSFQPIKVQPLTIKAAIEKGTLVLRGLEIFKDGGHVTIDGRLLSQYYPQLIQSATLSLDWVKIEKSKTIDLKNDIQPKKIMTLKPEGSIDNVKIVLQIPPLPPVWSADSLFGNGYEIRGVLRISLDDLDLVLTTEFQSQMNNIFGLGQLPEIFYPAKDLKKAYTDIPVRLVVEYPVWPLALLVMGLIVILLVLVIFLILVMRDKRYKVEIDGYPITVSVKPFKTITLYSREGKKAGKLRGALFSKPSLSELNNELITKLK
jgi:hypothetical protein